jgi:hypothetical protein
MSFFQVVFVDCPKEPDLLAFTVLEIVPLEPYKEFLAN